MDQGKTIPDNENGKKPDDKFTGKGRVAINLGDLKAEAESAAWARGMKLAPWIREAIEEKIAREHEFPPLFDPKVLAEIEQLQGDARITPHPKDDNAN